MSNLKKIIITGAPSSGKTTLVNQLKHLGYYCFPEISRHVTEQAQLQGIEQMFLHDPYLFSEKLLEGRMQQYYEAKEFSGIVFLDRGIPDIEAYLHFTEQEIPEKFIKASQNHVYDAVFLLPPWEAIYENDAQRYETFAQAELIDQHLKATYEKYGYQLHVVPPGTIHERVSYVLERL